jgi:hypothetical protein
LESPELQHKIKANTIWLRHGCDLQTHQDDTTHTRRRAIHVLSSQKTPEGTSLPQAFGGVCNLESAELKNKVTQNAFALNMDVTHRRTKTIQTTQEDVACIYSAHKRLQKVRALGGECNLEGAALFCAWQKTVTHHHCFGARDQV